MPIRAITNENNPKVAVNSDTLSPPAKISGSGFPIDCIESNAVIRPITEPKNPKTKASKLLSDANFNMLSEFEGCFFKFINPFTKKKIDSKKLINISDIKRGPPSLKRSTNCVVINT